MSEFKIGDYIKTDFGVRVFKLAGFTGNQSDLIPEGWLLDKNGHAVNPEFCKKYNGATSVFNEND